ncbi:adenosine receptor A3-like [Babylonia areolata]|uniref:adenosine receptor A3-like n=1 Tax=Babylonia areolata TaxID=304850 RepID=UPI003FCF28C7
MTWEHRDLVFLSAECTISAVSVVANGLVLSALWRFPSLRTTTNTLIGSLTLSDLLVSCVVGPTSAMTFHGVPQNLYGCIFFNCLAIVFTNVNVLNLLLITIERFLAVKYPIMHRRKVTNRKVRIAIGVAWLTGMLIGFVPLMGWYRRDSSSSSSSSSVQTLLTEMGRVPLSLESKRSKEYYVEDL